MHNESEKTSHMTDLFHPRLKVTVQIAIFRDIKCRFVGNQFMTVFIYPKEGSFFRTSAINHRNSCQSHSWTLWGCCKKMVICTLTRSPACYRLKYSTRMYTSIASFKITDWEDNSDFFSRSSIFV